MPGMEIYSVFWVANAGLAAHVGGDVHMSDEAFSYSVNCTAQKAA